MGAVTSYGYDSDGRVNSRHRYFRIYYRTSYISSGRTNGYYYRRSWNTAKEGMLAEVFTYKNSRSLSDKCVKYEYNSLQLVSKSTSKEGYIKTFEYDTNGKLIRTKDYGNNPLGTPIISRVIYDELGRVIKEVAPNQYDASLEAGNFGYDVNNTNRKYTRYLHVP